MGFCTGSKTVPNFVVLYVRAVEPRFNGLETGVLIWIPMILRASFTHSFTHWGMSLLWAWAKYNPACLKRWEETGESAGKQFY